MIKITPEAEEHLKSISESNGGKWPMLGIAGGGCAGFSYDWSLVSEAETDPLSDEIFDLQNGGKLVVDGTSLMYLYGTVIQLKKDVFGTVIEVVAPAAQSSCGCGESVNFDMQMVEDNMAMNAADFKLPD